MPAGAHSRRTALCPSTSTATCRPGSRAARSTRVRCDSRDVVEVIAFSAEELQQVEVRLPSPAEILADKKKADKKKANGSNGHSSNGHSSNGPKAEYKVVSANGMAAAAAAGVTAPSANGNGGNGHSNRNGHSNSNGNGHSNGNGIGNGNGKGKSKMAATAAPAAAAAATPAAAPAQTAQEPPAAPVTAAVPAVDTEALASQAAAAWSSCAAALALPGQQLSSVTFDCGVSVTINRSEPEATAATDASQDGEAGAPTADAAEAVASAGGGEYYVRVTLPPDYGRDCILHWGVENWELPSPVCRPPNSKQVRLS